MTVHALVRSKYGGEPSQATAPHSSGCQPTAASISPYILMVLMKRPTQW